MDPQGNLSQSAGYDDLGAEAVTVYEVLKGEDINKGIRTEHDYDVLPADIRLSAAEIELVNTERRNYLLKDALAALRARYDFILIDCPPSLNIFVMMALCTANEVIIPVQAQYLPLKGVAQLIETIDFVKDRFNKDLEISGILLTFYDDRRNLDKDVLEMLDQAFKGKVFKTRINFNTKVGEAPSSGMDVISYSPRCKGSIQYQQLTNEIINLKPQRRRV